MGTVESIVRPLNAKERRLMASAVAWRKGRLHKAPRRVLVFAGLMSALFWLAMVFASIHRKSGQDGFYKPLFVALGIVIPLSLWAYIRARSELKADLLRYEGALIRNEASVVRIQAERMIEFEEEDEGACYAFQLSGHRIVFVSGQDYYASARFPNIDFSLIEVRGDGGVVVESFLEKHGAKLKPIRRISAKEKSRMRTPHHLEVIPGDLENLEHSLAISTATQTTNGAFHE
jgi:hypothetical protein